MSEKESSISYKLHKEIDEINSQIFCVKYSPDNESILVGCGDGHLKVFDAHDGRNMYTWNTAGKSGIKLPVTSIKFRPFTKTRKNIVLVAGSGGLVQHWHITSGRCLNTISEENNQVYAVDYRSDGKFFATTGKDTCVRVYDEATKSLVVKMQGGIGNKTAGHANRVFTLKFHPTDPNVLVSGGWDNTVQIWDKRQDTAVRRIFGPKLCGESLDIDKKGVILTGSWRNKNQLQLWDYGTGKLIEDISLPVDPQTQQHTSIYSATFNSTANLIAIGGSGTNDAKVIDRHTGKIIGSTASLEKAFYSVAFSPDNQNVAAAGGDGNIYILKKSSSN
mmetsp:Transcript_3180/g.4697  ORF Transcript_3180/g.4697 Transcript_3180/m.4697 type:complete len:333 (+) Transcript_3180:89-1087(+)